MQSSVGRPDAAILPLCVANLLHPRRHPPGMTERLRTDLALALSGDVPFGQWNVCNACGVLPHWSAGACCDRREPLGFPRWAPIQGPCGADSRIGQPGYR